MCLIRSLLLKRDRSKRQVTITIRVTIKRQIFQLSTTHCNLISLAAKNTKLYEKDEYEKISKRFHKNFLCFDVFMIF